MGHNSKITEPDLILRVKIQTTNKCYGQKCVSYVKINSFIGESTNGPTDGFMVHNSIYANFIPSAPVFEVLIYFRYSHVCLSNYVS